VNLAACGPAIGRCLRFGGRHADTTQARRRGSTPGRRCLGRRSGRLTGAHAERVGRDRAGHGTITRAGEYRNGRQHGLWTRYFEAGQGDLFSGELNSQFQGPFVSEATFVDGKLDGAWTITGRDGRKIIEWHFENGTRHGKSSWWYPSGEKRLVVTYNNGVLDGDFLEWGPDGQMLGTTTFTDGRALVKEVKWYAPGKKSYEGHFLTSFDLSVPVYDWWNGTIEAVSLSQDAPDQKHGVWTSWYPNGQTKANGVPRKRIWNRHRLPALAAPTSGRDRTTPT